MSPTKVCKECKKEYQFYGQKTLLCSPCRTIYNRNYYHQRLNKPKMLKTKQNRHKETRQAIWDFLNKNPCCICGESDPIVLEFDHLDQSTKIYNISEMRSLSISKIEEEILKCRVLCANCHRRHTAKQLNWYEDLNTN